MIPNRGVTVATLHIEHPIVDFDMWSTAFERFADIRKRSGVRGQRVSRPVDDTHYVIIDLDFDAVDEAQEFLTFLETNVWSSQETAPALAGRPETVIFDRVASDWTAPGQRR